MCLFKYLVYIPSYKNNLTDPTYVKDAIFGMVHFDVYLIRYKKIIIKAKKQFLSYQTRP